jgi:hypothetical protein
MGCFGDVLVETGKEAVPEFRRAGEQHGQATIPGRGRLCS